MSEVNAEEEQGPAVVAWTDGSVAVLRIDRARTRNALTDDVLEGLVEGLDAAEFDSTVRAVVITGGERFFASGADIRRLRDLTPAAYMSSTRSAAWQRFARFPKPMVAAAAGFCLGGGSELALLCDFIVAADNAVFGQPEVGLGILPGAGGTQRWARVEGRFRAADRALRDRRIDAWAAERHGIVNQVVPAERVVDAGIALAQSVSRFSPVATRSIKAALRSSEEMPVSAALDYERSLLGVLLSTEDHLEGIDAFLEKRPPYFEGR